MEENQATTDQNTREPGCGCKPVAKRPATTTAQQINETMPNKRQCPLTEDEGSLRLLPSTAQNIPARVVELSPMVRLYLASQTAESRPVAEARVFNTVTESMNTNRDKLEAFINPPKEYKFLTRTSLQKLNNVNAKLNEVQIRAIDNVGFGPITRISFQRIDKLLVRWLVGKYDPDGEIIELHGKYFKLNDHSVNRVLGIPLLGNKIALQKSSTMGKERYGHLFKWTPDGRIDLCDLHKKLINCEVSDSNFIVMYLALLFGTVLFPGGHPGLHMCYLNPLVDFDEIGNNNWCDLLLRQLQKGVREWRNRKNQHCDGCILYLEIWFMGMARPRSSTFNCINPFTETPFIDHLTGTRITFLKRDLRLSGNYWNASSFSLASQDNDSLGNTDSNGQSQSGISFHAQLESSYDDSFVVATNNSSHICLSTPPRAVWDFTSHYSPKKGDSSPNYLSREYAIQSLPPAVRQLFRGGGNPTTLRPSKIFRSSHIAPRALHYNLPTKPSSVGTGLQTPFPVSSYIPPAHTSSIDVVSPYAEDLEIVSYILNADTNLLEKVIDLGPWHISRSSLQCLKAITNIDASILDCLAYQLTLETKDAEARFATKWFLPASFAQCCLSDAHSDEYIMDTFLRGPGNFTGYFSSCQKIYIPINDIHEHWFLSIIEFRNGGKAWICDTCPVPGLTDYRKGLLQRVLQRLDNLLPLCGLNYMHKFIALGFDFEEANWVPKDPEMANSGFNVGLMMKFDSGMHTPLRKGASLLARHKLALYMYRSTYNKYVWTE